MGWKYFTVFLIMMLVSIQLAIAQETLISEEDSLEMINFLFAFGIVFFLFFILFLILFLIAVYVYTSFAFMAIAEKAKYPNPKIAWIPYIGASLITSKTAKMHWWPVLLLLGFFIPFVGSLLALVFYVFFIIWLWKTYEVVGYPGWFAVFMIIPIVGLVLLGIVAWGKEEKAEKIKKFKVVKKVKKKSRKR